MRCALILIVVAMGACSALADRLAEDDAGLVRLEKAARDLETLDTQELRSALHELFHRWPVELSENARTAGRAKVLLRGKIVPRLIAFVRAGDRETAEIAVRCLEKLASFGLGNTSALEALLTSPDPAVRAMAADGIRSNGADGGSAARSLESLLGDSNARVARRAAGALGRIGLSGRLALMRAVAGQNRVVQEVALGGLLEPPTDAAVLADSDLSRLEGLSRGEDAQFNTLAFAALATNGHPGVSDPLLATLISRFSKALTGGAANERCIAANGLGRLGTRAKTTGRILLSAFRAQGEGSTLAIEALAEVGASPEMLPALIRAIPDPNPRVRIAVAKSIESMGRLGSGAQGALRSQRSAESDTEVRAALDRALTKLSAQGK